MWDEMLALQAPVIATILRTVVVYVAVVILIRLTGKRGLAEMSTFDIVVALLLAEFVGAAALGEETSLAASSVRSLSLP